MTVYTQFGYGSVDLSNYEKPPQQSEGGAAAIEDHVDAKQDENKEAVKRSDNMVEVQYKWGVGYIEVGLCSLIGLSIAQADQVENQGQR